MMSQQETTVRLIIIGLLAVAYVVIYVKNYYLRKSISKDLRDVLQIVKSAHEQKNAAQQNTPDPQDDYDNKLRTRLNELDPSFYSRNGRMKRSAPQTVMIKQKQRKG